MASISFTRPLRVAIVLLVCSFSAIHMVHSQPADGGQAAVLTPSQIGGIMPQSVFFKGQTATVQLRNAFGLKSPDGALTLAGLVDSSGYSSGIRQKYQGYLLSERALTINGKTLPPGAYGFGFLASGVFAVMDLGAHDVLQTKYRNDTGLSRPRPLLIVAGQHAGSYRLYEGRDFVSIRIR